MGWGGIRMALSEQRQRRIYPLQWRNRVTQEWQADLPLAFYGSRTDDPSANPLPVIAFPTLEGVSVDIQECLSSIKYLKFDQFKVYLPQPHPPYAPLYAQPLTELPDSSHIVNHYSALRIPLPIDPAVLVQGLAALFAQVLASLDPHHDSHNDSHYASHHNSHDCQSPDLAPADLHRALTQLTSVILSCPSDFSAPYQAHLREAVLQAGLVQKPSQVVFLEEPTAVLFSHAPFSQLPLNPNAQILVIHSSESRTDLGLFSLPQATQPTLITLNVGQLAFTQAIIGELLYPLVPATERHRSPLETFHLPPIPPLTSLAINDPQTLLAIQQRQWQLQQSPLGGILLQAAEQLQSTFATQEQFTLRIGQNTHIVQRQEWQHRILDPYQRWIEAGVSQLLHTSNTAIEYVLTTGKLGQRPWFRQSIQHWLNTQFPDVQPFPGAVAEGLGLATPVVGLAQFPLCGVPI